MSYEFSRKPRLVPAVATMYRHIRTEIPAAGTKEVLERRECVEHPSMCADLPLVIDEARGEAIFDIRGNRFLDFTSGIFAASIGHNNHRLVSALHAALNNEALHPYDYATKIRVEYLERLTAWSGFSKAFLLSQGTEATECALKLMKLHALKTQKRRPGIVCIGGAFHGRTLGAQLVCQDAKNREWIGFDDPAIIRVPWPSPEILTAKQQTAGEFFRCWVDVILRAKGLDASRDLCGVMLETFEGWSARFFPPDFVQEIEKFCREHDMLLCFDEMQSGFARTGRKFGYEHYSVKPDLICVGKGMGGGFPVSGVLCGDSVASLASGDMSNTHSGSPLACAAGLAVIDEIERLDLVRESDVKGQILLGRLYKEISRGHVTAIEGRGLIAAIHFDSAEFASRVAERCYEKGLLVVHTGRESIKLGPPLTIPDAALIEGVSVIAEAIEELS